MPAQPDFQERLKLLERLLQEIDSAADPSLRTNVQGLMHLVMDLHGAGLERMLELIGAAPDGGEKMIQKLGHDELVSSLLILYGLHPVTLETRVAQALDKLRPKLSAREAKVDLLSMEDGAVRLRLQANGHGCGSTGDALKEMVENAVYQAAPDLAALVVEGAEASKQGFVPLEMLQRNIPQLTGAEKGSL